MTDPGEHLPASAAPHSPDGPGASATADRLKIVVAGAGFAGLTLAQGLRREAVKVTLVDRQNHHLFQPLLYQVATAGLSPADIAAPIRSIVKGHRDVHVLLAEVSGVDLSARRVRLSDGRSLAYDVLVLATGVRHSYFGRDDWAAFAPGLKTLDDATDVRRRVLLALERAEEAEPGPERDRELTFALVGGGPTGVEMAGAIAELTRHAVSMDFRHITDARARVFLLEAGPRLLASFPEDLSASAQRALERLGVEVRLNTQVSGIDADGLDTPDGRIDAATRLWTAGVRASPVAEWLGLQTPDRAGRIAVSPDLSLPGHAEVFVIGDAAAVLTADGRPVPGVAPAAKQMGAYVARVLAARLHARPAPEPFRYKDHGALATVGRKRAVADLGWIKLRGTPAWLLWCVAHVYFLVGFRNRFVVGANWFWNYLTFDRGARLITGQTTRESALEAQAAPAPAPVAT